MIILLIVFTVRRLILVFAATLPVRRCTPGIKPSMLVILAARNEQEHLPRLLGALDRLNYSSGKICFVVVNDASHDATGNILKSWAEGRKNARYIGLTDRYGKARALNLVLDTAPETELVAVYDADLVPRIDSLGILAATFSDPKVAAVSGYRKPSNAEQSPVAAYGALETFVHQLITQAGKERLGLNPTTLGGNCVYRRSVLQQVGAFPPGSLSEDIEVSLAMVAAGWSTRFCREAVAESTLVASFRRYWNQRTRWTRGLYQSKGRASRPESWLVSAGYLDRLVFLAALAITAAGYMNFLWPMLFLMAPVIEAGCALARADLGKKVTAYILLWSLPMFSVDICVTVAATFKSLLGRRQEWMTGGPSA